MRVRPHCPDGFVEDTFNLVPSKSHFPHSKSPIPTFLSSSPRPSVVIGAPLQSRDFRQRAPLFYNASVPQLRLGQEEDGALIKPSHPPPPPPQTLLLRPLSVSNPFLLLFIFFFVFSLSIDISFVRPSVRRSDKRRVLSGSAPRNLTLCLSSPLLPPVSLFLTPSGFRIPSLHSCAKRFAPG